MIINTILIITYFSLFIEKYYNKGLKHSIAMIFHTIFMFLMFYILFIFYNRKHDDRIFEKNVLDKQLKKVIKELEDNTDISMTGNIPEKQLDKNKTLSKTDEIIIALSVFAGIIIILVLLDVYKFKLLHSSYYKSILFSTVILGIVEIVFSAILSSTSLKEKRNSDITEKFLSNVKKYSNFN